MNFRKESDRAATDKISSQKNTSSANTMDSLDGFSSFEGSEDQGWTVVQKKTKGLKSGKSMQLCNFQNSDKKVKVKRSQSFDGATLGVKNGFSWDKGYSNEDITRGSSDNFEPATPDCFRNHDTVSFPKLDVNSNLLNTTEPFSIPHVKNPIKQLKPVGQEATGVEPSQGLNGNTTEKNIPPKIDTLCTNSVHEIRLDTVEPTPSNLGFEQQVPALPNCTESHIQLNPLSDTTILQIPTHHSGSLPGLKAKDDIKSNEKLQGKDKKKQNLTSFDILMSQLAENFPSKTR